ncbi:MAG: radical SAM protein [Candidatus Bathyarchaeota archaeon]|nr:radical SAM protein [Candidatus Bathyarchaeota archaeon]
MRPPDRVRVSLGTSTILGLDLTLLAEKPTTAYLQTFFDGRCLANCKFCAQARNSSAEIYRVARALYPPYQVEAVLNGLERAFNAGRIFRVCIQTLNYPGMLEDLKSLVKSIKLKVDVPVSVSIHPISKNKMVEIFEIGASNMVIPLDAASKDVFEEIKGSKAGNYYTWDDYWGKFEEALKVFGKGKVGTHIIVGLGEKEKDLVETIQKLYDLGVYCGLFAFTPIPKTLLGNAKRPSIASYRTIQLAHYLIALKMLKLGDVLFDKEGKILGFNIEKKKLLKIISSGKPFQTTGCPHCNRPFATETPDEVYNFPRKLKKDETKLVIKQLSERLKI